MSDLDPPTLCQRLQSLGGFQPQVLESRFPHVVERLARLWESDEMPGFLDSLLDRQPRFGQGFPGDALAEIAEIRRIHRTWQQERQAGTASNPFGELLTPEMIAPIVISEENPTDSTILDEKLNALRRGFDPS